jgi:sulfite dehydrogenase (cytochrome) subunit B
LSKHRIVFVVPVAIMGLTVSTALHSQQPPAKASNQAAKAASSVHTIVLPQYPPEIAEGPNVAIYSKNCLICHTARYVSMQPRFSKTVWQSEVKKMVDAYGAAIPEADQALIVEYLVAIKGAEAPAAMPASPK